MTNDTHPRTDRTSVLDVVRALAAAHFRVLPESIAETTRFREDLSGDSLDLVLLVHEVEDAFGIVVAPEDLERVRSLGDAADVVQRSRGA